MSERTRMQDEIDPRCVWVMEGDDETPDHRCNRPARWEYMKKVSPPGKLPYVERYTMCGKHASEKNRAVVAKRGYTIREIEPYEDAS